MTGNPLARAASISCLMYSRATQLSSPQEVRQRSMDSRMGSGRSPQNAQLTSITSSAGRLPNPALAPNPPAANTALSRLVRNLSQIRWLIEYLLSSSQRAFPPALLHRGTHSDPRQKARTIHALSIETYHSEDPPRRRHLRGNALVPAVRSGTWLGPEATLRRSRRIALRPL